MVPYSGVSLGTLEPPSFPALDLRGFWVLLFMRFLSRALQIYILIHLVAALYTRWLLPYNMEHFVTVSTPKIHSDCINENLARFIFFTWKWKSYSSKSKRTRYIHRSLKGRRHTEKYASDLFWISQVTTNSENLQVII